MSASGPSKSTTQQSTTDARVGVETGTAVGGSGNQVQITNADADVVKAVGLGAFDLVKAIVGNQASQATQQEVAQGQQYEATLAAQAAQLQAITDLGKTTATGGQSDFNKTILYLGVAVGGFIALIFIFRRH